MNNNAATDDVPVHDLLDHIAQGKILEAMERFYAPNASMQENANPPTVGLEAYIEREKQFLANVKEFHAFEATAVATGPGLSIVESEMRFTDQSDQEVTLQQVSVQRWKDGKIVSERFYYDSGA